MEDQFLIYIYAKTASYQKKPGSFNSLSNIEVCSIIEQLAHSAIFITISYSTRKESTSVIDRGLWHYLIREAVKLRSVREKSSIRVLDKLTSEKVKLGIYC